MIVNDTSDPQRVKTDSAAATDVYTGAMEALRRAESGTGFTSEYDATIARLYDKLLGREPFRYDAASDPLYGQAREQFTVLGRQAMRDSQGQAAALTGGYGSSYSQTVGQQQYDAALQRLTDSLPQLYEAAFRRYEAEGDALKSRLSLAGGLRDTAYREYRDALGDEQARGAAALQQAENLAQYGDFSGYAALYGEETAHRMQLAWAAKNPDAAYAAGGISAAEYRRLTGRNPRDVVTGYGGYGGGYGGKGKSKDDGGLKHERVGDAQLVSKAVSGGSKASARGAR